MCKTMNNNQSYQGQGKTWNNNNNVKTEVINVEPTQTMGSKVKDFCTSKTGIITIVGTVVVACTGYVTYRYFKNKKKATLGVDFEEVNE